MRPSTSLAVMALFGVVASIPITPAAPEHQLLVEQFRSQGLNEHDIAERLSLPITNAEADPRSFYSHMSSKVHSLFSHPFEQQKRHSHEDGDIAPGTLEIPQMLPRAAVVDSSVDGLFQMIGAVFGSTEIQRKEYGYEGKELEIRRPEGSMHWSS
ncbi:hypothetical protein BDV95DRAFT_486945 [Massariosphaeria phaeospora]|uniref:Uncharacterized protein n=1 Tax=Massariosphaeria phaeospora TaxID=100035 RepID=A0A7C8IKV6_9PLEO|nr:hypothetical protein BDV95DRAFT_486945 [Massariosphaeria phaeospora]